MWQLALWQAFPVKDLLRLSQLLGEWLYAPNQSIHHWHWLTLYSTQRLYHWTRRWTIHAQHRGHSNRNPKYSAKESGEMLMLLSNCKRITITTAATYLTPSTRQGQRENQANDPTTWQEFINQLPTKETIKHTLIFPHNDKRQWLASINATRN